MDSPNSTAADTRLTTRASILLPLPLAGTYDYLVPDGMILQAGDYVVVPLGTRERIGVVWGPGGDALPAARLKAIRDKCDAPPMPADLRAFIDWVAGYTIQPPGAVLRMAMRVPAALTPPTPVTAFRASHNLPARMTAARQRVLDVVQATEAPLTAAEIARKAQVSNAVVRGLADSGALTRVTRPRHAPVPQPALDTETVTLSPDQQTAADSLRASIAEAAFSVTLLEGVTGSGKTEVYFDAIAETLRRGQQALILLPEIALTVQFLSRFEARFGCQPAAWHSELSPPRRQHIWRAVAEGEVRVLVGARSALFLPFAELGLIVVDEEHDPAFKQEEGVIYQARDMAVVRASLGEFPIVLASATPSLETRVNVESGRYRTISLSRRHGGAQLPTIEAVDMRAAALPADRWLSPRLVTAMRDSLARGEQVLLFLNRRGYAPLTLCRACGHRLACPQCSAWLVEHRFQGRVQCHHCGFETAKPESCPACGEEDRLVPCGPGVERLAEEVALLLPDITPAILSGDNPRERGLSSVRDTIDAFGRGEIRLLIGTQIIAKGHHFPGLTLVGVVDADLGLAGGDLRAAERTYQLLHQVSGRAGRGNQAGHVILQSYMPEHPVMQALVSGDSEQFLTAETAARRARRLPPFGRLVALILSGPDLEQLRQFATTLARTAPHGDGISVLGPAPAPLALLRGRHRYRLLLMADRRQDIQQTIRHWLARHKVPNAVRLHIDVDPYSFL
ncbi:MAG TPA: primosomal protein N' [Alphaproteobacteria bacterium]|nr:primosomal protein N' [Alphaproteobacteria bacterium]